MKSIQPSGRRRISPGAGFYHVQVLEHISGELCGQLFMLAYFENTLDFVPLLRRCGLCDEQLGSFIAFFKKSLSHIRQEVLVDTFYFNPILNKQVLIKRFFAMSFVWPADTGYIPSTPPGIPSRQKYLVKLIQSKAYGRSPGDGKEEA
jgi:hypothetical protein